MIQCDHRHGIHAGSPGAIQFLQRGKGVATYDKEDHLAGPIRQFIQDLLLDMVFDTMLLFALWYERDQCLSQVPLVSSRVFWNWGQPIAADCLTACIPTMMLLHRNVCWLFQRAPRRLVLKVKGKKRTARSFGWGIWAFSLSESVHSRSLLFRRTHKFSPQYNRTNMKLPIALMAFLAVVVSYAHCEDRVVKDVESILGRISTSLSDRQFMSGNLAGFIQNGEGTKCTYFQLPTEDESESYFFDSLTGADTVMVFDDSSCMDFSDELARTLNIMMINNVISNWYSHPDAAFMTREEDLRTASFMQKRGYCLQSRTYSSQAILVDYLVLDGKLAMVVHNVSVGACK